MDDRTFLDALGEAVDRCLEHARGSEQSPRAVLWPDEARHWDTLIARLGDSRPVLTLGSYAPDSRTGPAYWLRCQVDGTPDSDRPGGVPVVYLPGYGRSLIRAVEDAPPELRPIAELQYRGTIFAQQSGRDWTLAAFLQASPSRGGLGIDVVGDEATKAALLRARDQLADVPVESLRRKAPLRADFFDGLLTPDLARDVLRWLNDPKVFRTSRSEAQWAAFCAQFLERFGMELTRGELDVAQRLGARETDSWEQVWQAYADAPTRYPNIESLLRRSRPVRSSERRGLFDRRGSWPQDNEDGEQELREALGLVADLAPAAARTRLIELDQIHSERRDWVWARQGRSPLASAIETLAALAKATSRPLPAGPLPAIVEEYTGWGWQADDALVRSIALVDGVDADLAGAAAAAVYRPWLEAAAEGMQAAVTADEAAYSVESLVGWPGGTCVLFTDGLRFDVGHRLQDALVSRGLDVEIRHRLTALPSITPTAKPAASPAVERLKAGPAFAPIAERGGPDIGAPGLRKELEAIGYQVLGGSEIGDPSGLGWSEGGDIDALGHEHQARLPALLDSEVQKLASRVQSLLDGGWERVAVVTDHGWLYLPGGLPHAEMPLHLTEGGKLRKHRAARLASGSRVDVPTVGWYWDPTVCIAVAPDIRSFEGSPVYDHGGISPQECVTPLITVTKTQRSPTDVTVVVAWRGLRATASTAGAPAGATVDIRRQAGDPETSLATKPAPINADGIAAPLIKDGDDEGAEAWVVVVGPDGRILAQQRVTAGGEG